MKVLITDDMFTSRIQTGIVLKSIGYTYEEAANGQQAIEKLEEGDFDLVLMDIEMPVMNGLETTYHIRKHIKDKRKSGVCIIALTAHDLEDFEKNFGRYGFDGFLSKPVSVQKLKTILTDKGLQKA